MRSFLTVAGISELVGAGDQRDGVREEGLELEPDRLEGCGRVESDDEQGSARVRAPTDEEARPAVW